MARRQRIVSDNLRVCLSPKLGYCPCSQRVVVFLQEILNEVNRMKRLFSPLFPSLSAEIETTVAGDQFQRDVRHWLSPPDPSTNHHIVWKGHHKGTGKWFFESSILSDWKSTGSLLWIHGKRTLPRLLSTRHALITSLSYSWFR